MEQKPRIPAPPAADVPKIKAAILVHHGSGFNNDATPERYNKAAADQAWRRTIEWFIQYVRGASNS
jgi:carboxymethylenebutenolidase